MAAENVDLPSQEYILKYIKILNSYFKLIIFHITIFTVFLSILGELNIVPTPKALNGSVYLWSRVL